VKLNLSLLLIKHNAMKMYGGWRYSSTVLDLGTRDELSRVLGKRGK
jgi:hypothetical protein